MPPKKENSHEKIVLLSEIICQLTDNVSLENGGVQIDLTFLEQRIIQNDEFDAFITALSACVNLTSFVIRSNSAGMKNPEYRGEHPLLDPASVGSRFKLMVPILQEKNFLRKLVVNGVTITKNVFLEFAKCFSRLVELDISFVYLNGHESFSSLFSGLEAAEKLRIFRYRGHSFSVEQFGSLLELFEDRKHFVAVELDSDHLTDEQKELLRLLPINQEVVNRIKLAKKHMISGTHQIFDFSNMGLSASCISKLIPKINLGAKSEDDCANALTMALILSGNPIGDNGLNELLCALDSDSHVQLLLLRGISSGSGEPFAEETRRYLLEVFERKPSLFRIQLDESFLKDISGERLTAFGEKIQKIEEMKGACKSPVARPSELQKRMGRSKSVSGLWRFVARASDAEDSAESVQSAPCSPRY